jgi:hypothetical protein
LLDPLLRLLHAAGFGLPCDIGGWYREADDGGAGATSYVQAQAICANVN